MQMLKNLAKFFFTFSVFFAVWGLSGVRHFSTAVLIFSTALALIFAIFAYPEEFCVPKIFKENPFFLASCVLLGMGIIQMLNPSFQIVPYSDIFLIKHLDHIKWLPSGVLADSENYSTKRYLSFLVIGALFANTAWAIRKDVKFFKFILKFFAFNCFLMSILAIVQVKTNATAPYWTFNCKSAFFGAFYYANACGAFLNLGIATMLACGYLCAKKRNFFGIIFWASQIGVVIYAFQIATSVGARVSSALFLLVSIFSFLFFKLLKKYPKNLYKISIILSICLVAVLTFLCVLGASIYNNMGKPKQDSLKSRLDNPIFALQVYKKAPILGSGFGSFPIIASNIDDQYKERNFRAAHNDLLNYACEFGIVGILAIGSTFFIWLKILRKKKENLSFANWILLLGVCLCVLHSMCDILLTVPSIMIAFTLIMTSTTQSLTEDEN